MGGAGTEHPQYCVDEGPVVPIRAPTGLEEREQRIEELSLGITQPMTADHV
jgi:hypothetical protein